jgi:hypothetical protein
LLKRNFNLKFAFPRIKQFTVNDWLFVFVYLCFFLGGTLFLLSRASDQALTSPWQVAGWQFFCFYLPEVMKNVAKEIEKFKNIPVLDALDIILPKFGFRFKFHFTEILIDVAYQFPNYINLFYYSGSASQRLTK